MKKTREQVITESTITTDIEGLIQLLGCGKETAKAVAERAEARVRTDGRRVIYSIEKIKKYCADNTF